jgi:transposase
MRVAPSIVLSAKEEARLRRLARGRRTSVRLAQRSRIVLLAAAGLQNQQIATHLSIDRETAGRWRHRYLESGLAGIEKDAPRPGRRPSISQAKVREVVNKTIHSTPSDATHWSTRTMAAEAGISAASVRRIWKRHGLKPHLIRTFKLSSDPHFIEKLHDVVGLYLDPPEHALVLSVDEKSQIQALDRTQPGLPLKKGRCGTMTHDYKRHGTTTLFAALNTVDGTVIGTCMPRHRHQEWLKFLKLIDTKTPRDKDLHLIVDNYATHKQPAVKQWLTKHPRFHIHFTPTSASWLNMIERFFRDLTQKRLRRGAFRGVADLVAAIEQHVQAHNSDPAPYIWTQSATDILAKVNRAHEAANKRASV